jgi:hypothetical protein
MAKEKSFLLKVRENWPTPIFKIKPPEFNSLFNFFQQQEICESFGFIADAGPHLL